MKLQLKLTENGNEYHGVFDSEKQEIRMEAALFSLSFLRKNEYGLTEFTPVLTAKKDFAPTEIRLSVDLCELLNDTAENVLVYDAAPGTNAFAGVKNLKDIRDNPSDDIFFAHNKENTALFSRDIFMAHTSCRDFAIAQTTFDRFFTGFLCDGVTVEFFEDLEDKPIKASTVLTLETFAIDVYGGLAFFDKYTELLSKKYNVSPKKDIPCGWSSWSCYANAINTEIITKDSETIAETVAKKGGTLIQIDDGWEVGGPFDGTWMPDISLFENMSLLGEKIKSLGLRFGLWTAPGILGNNSAKYREFEEEMKQSNGENIPSFGAFYPMNVGKQKVLEYVKNAFEYMHKTLGADYFKVDFIGNILYRQGNGNTAVRFEDGYCVEQYRRFLRVIRETVGDDVFLDACGATVGESIGIFDGTRVTPDITWGGCGSPNHPGAFEILRMDALNCLYRSPYHGKLFICDPDALVLRGEEAVNSDDGLCLNYEEAKMRACVVAMSGGHVLLNENTSTLPKEKYELFADIVPTLGLAAKPVDFWEMPYPTRSVIEIDENTRFYAFYNWSAEEKTLSVDLPDGEWHTVDCFTKQPLGTEQTTITKTLAPHTCVAFLAKRRCDMNAFFYEPKGFFLGYAD